jgi:outer membrane protein assembly factor BamB
MKTNFPAHITRFFLILVLLPLSMSLSCSIFSNGINSSITQTSGVSVTQTINNENQPTPFAESNILWKTVINNAAPNAYYDYPIVSINSTADAPFFTIFPSYSVNEVSIIPPMLPELNASIGGLNFNIYRSYIISNDSIYTLNENQQVVKSDLLNGHKQWESSQQGSLLGVGEKNVFINREDNRLFALDKDTGKENWHLILESLVPSGITIDPTGEILSSSGLVIVPVGLREGIYIDQYCGFFALREDTGEVVWTLFSHYLESLFIKDGVIFSRVYNLGGGDLTYEAINVTDGMTAYQIDGPKNEIGAIEIMNIDYFNPSDGTLIYDYSSIVNPNYEQHYFAINVVSGQSIWAQELIITTDQAVKFREITDKYAIFSNTNKLLIYNIPSCDKFAEINKGRPFASYLAQNNIAIISFPELGNTQGFDLTTQKIIWEDSDLNIATQIADTFPNLVIENTLIISDPTTFITTAYNVVDGKQLWSKRLIGDNLVNAFQNRTSRVFLSDFCKVYIDLLFCVDIDNNLLFAIEPSTGNVKMQVDSTSGIPMTIQHIKDDIWLIQDLSGGLTLMKLIKR